MMTLSDFPPLPRQSNPVEVKESNQSSSWCTAAKVILIAAGIGAVAGAVFYGYNAYHPPTPLHLDYDEKSELRQLLNPVCKEVVGKYCRPDPLNRESMVCAKDYLHPEWEPYIQYDTKVQSKLEVMCHVSLKADTKEKCDWLVTQPTPENRQRVTPFPAVFEDNAEYIPAEIPQGLGERFTKYLSNFLIPSTHKAFEEGKKIFLIKSHFDCKYPGMNSST